MGNAMLWPKESCDVRQCSDRLSLPITQMLPRQMSKDKSHWAKKYHDMYLAAIDFKQVPEPHSPNNPMSWLLNLVITKLN